jgi:hypothetical protein
MYNLMKPPYFSLNIRLLFSDLFRILTVPDPVLDPQHCFFGPLMARAIAKKVEDKWWG